jgi:hypothetical protein
MEYWLRFAILLPGTLRFYFIDSNTHHSSQSRDQPATAVQVDRKKVELFPRLTSSITARVPACRPFRFRGE